MNGGQVFEIHYTVPIIACSFRLAQGYASARSISFLEGHRLGDEPGAELVVVLDEGLRPSSKVTIFDDFRVRDFIFSLREAGAEVGLFLL